MGLLQEDILGHKELQEFKVCMVLENIMIYVMSQIIELLINILFLFLMHILSFFSSTAS